MRLNPSARAATPLWRRWAPTSPAIATQGSTPLNPTPTTSLPRRAPAIPVSRTTPRRSHHEHYFSFHGGIDHAPVQIIARKWARTRRECLADRLRPGFAALANRTRGEGQDRRRKLVRLVR